MDSNAVEQLIQHMSNQNIKVRLEALNIAFQMTGTKENREQMRKAGLTKQVLRAIPELNLIEKAGAILLNLSQDDDFPAEVLELNGIKRIVDNIKENLVSYTKVEGKEQKKEEVKTEDGDEKKVATEEELLFMSIQLQLLFLQNISRDDEVKKHILELNREEQFHGLNFGFMLSWFNHPKIAPVFHFFGNILANLSSIVEFRKFMIDPKHKLLENTVNSIISVENNRRQGILKMLRNIFFEYEDEKALEYFMNEKIDLFNVLLKCALFNIVRGLASDPDLEDELEEAQKMAKKHDMFLEEEDTMANLQQVFDEIDVIVDIFLVITNVDPEKHKLKIDEDLLKFVVDNLNELSKSDGMKDKLNVISVLLLKENNQIV